MTLEEMITTLAPLVRQLTADCSPSITPALILAMIYLESKGDAGTINPRSRATGLMQVMPREANPQKFGDRPTQAQLLDPETNIRWGIRILQWSLRGDRTLEEGLYYYSGGTTWQDRGRYERMYWRPLQKYRLRIAKLLMEEPHG